MDVPVFQTCNALAAAPCGLQPAPDLTTTTAIPPTLLFDYTRAFSERARAVVIGVVLAALAFGVATRFAADPSGPDGMKVFGSYWASGQAWARGLNPYAIYPETWRFDLGGLRFVDLNLNPPILLPLFRAFALFDLVTGARLWAVISALLALASAEILLRGRIDLQKRQVLWIFAAPALGDTIAIGQIYVVLFLVSTLAWLALREERFSLAGIMIGLLVVMKPIFVLWPVYLFIAGHRRPAVVSGVVATGLCILALWLLGVEVHCAWIVALTADRHGLIPTDASLRGYFGRVGLPVAGLSIAALLLVSTLAWTWRRRPSLADATGIGLAVALLTSPLAWFHYVIVLVPVLTERGWGRTMTIAALLLFVPVGLPLSVTNGSFLASATFGGLYVGGLLLVLADLLARSGASIRPGLPRPRAARGVTYGASSSG